ncbi:Septin-5, partial [Ataeniobius toweri]|nr:Septin-5 [Ataeniobius toweri]
MLVFCSWTPVTNYINQQFEQYFRDESGLNRKNIQDNRVHCCLYFISPFGQGLRPVDVEFMKALQDKVNVVPLIAKADCLTPSEIKKLKEQTLPALFMPSMTMFISASATFLF